MTFMVGQMVDHRHTCSILALDDKARSMHILVVKILTVFFEEFLRQIRASLISSAIFLCASSARAG